MMYFRNKPSGELQAFFRRHFSNVTFIQGTVLDIPTLKLAKVGHRTHRCAFTESLSDQVENLTFIVGLYTNARAALFIGLATKPRKFRVHDSRKPK